MKYVTGRNNRLIRQSMEGEQNNRQWRPADVMRISILIVSILLFMIGFIEMILAIVLPQNNLDFEFAVAAAPVPGLVLLYFVIALTIIINPIGFFGMLLRHQKMAYLYFFAAVFLVLCQLSLFVFLTLAVNGALAVGSRDINSNELGGPSVESDTFADDTQKRIVQFAVDSPADFITLQEDNVCCGLNLQAVYGFGINGFDLAEFHRASQCGNVLTEMDTLLRLTNDTFSDAAIELVQNDDQFSILSGQSFFCEEDFAQLIREVGNDFAVLFGIQCFFQLLLLVFYGLVTFIYEQKEGGLKPNDGPTSASLKVENTVLVEAGYQTGQKTRGRTPIGSVASRKAGKPAKKSGMKHLKFER